MYLLLQVNEAKSKILSHTGTPTALPVLHHDRPFPILGANVALSAAAAKEWEELMIGKQMRYFAQLSAAHLHSQIEFTLLKICATPRIQYACSVHPPDQTGNLTRTFDEEVVKRIEWLLDPTGNTKCSHDMVHSRHGLGIPHYSTHRHELFAGYQQMTVNNAWDHPRVSLINCDTPATAKEAAQVDAQWLFYDARCHSTDTKVSWAFKYI